MLYDVTYQVGGEERTDRVDAPDAASAAALVRETQAGSEDLFELLLVHLLDDGERADLSASSRDGDLPADL